MTTEAAGQGPALSEGLGAGAEAQCWCRACERKTAAAAIGRGDFFGSLPRFIVCPHCGDKRCLHAWSHEAPCAKADLYAHNAWVERMALRADPASGHDMPQVEAVIALGAWEAPNAAGNRLARQGQSG